MTCRELCATKIKREFHWTRLLLRHKNWETLAYVPWLPYNKWQIVYVIVRWILCLYFMAWLIVSGVQYAHPTWPTYLTNWGLLTWFLYLLVAAMACTAKYAKHMYQIFKPASNHDCENVNSDSRNSVDFLSSNIEVPSNVEFPNSGELASIRELYSDWKTDSIAWYQKIQWILHTLASSLVLGIAFLYWTVLYDREQPVSGVSIHTHLIPAIIVLIEVWALGIVMNFYHIYMVVIFGFAYSIFTIIYWGAGGLDYQGNRYIYSIIDFGSYPGVAAAVLLGCTFVCFPIMYFLLYGMSLLRRWLVSKFQRKFQHETVAYSSRDLSK